MTERVVGYAPGVYDLFHIGHLNLLRSASDHCDHLIAGVLSDELATKNKGLAPVVPFVERREIVGSIGIVGEAVAEDLPHKLDMWERLRFDVIVKGDDWKGTDKGDKLEADFATVGVRVVYVPYTPTTSTTILRRTLRRAEDGLA